MSTGRLLPVTETPATGERIEPIVALRTLGVEQILSGRVDERLDYLQDHDEWVVVLEGAAVLEIDGTRVELGAGNWAVLPADVPHSLLSVEPGTNWLAVHGRA